MATERDLLDLLHKRYNAVTMDARRYAVAEHVPTSTGGAQHIADFVALDVWTSKLDFHGHEVKCSRADWLAELRQPRKAQAIKRYMHYWWLVVSDASIVKPGELPDDWGLLVVTSKGLRATRPAPRLTPEPASLRFVAAFTRAVQKTSSDPQFASHAMAQYGTTVRELRRSNAALQTAYAAAQRDLRRLQLEQRQPPRHAEPGSGRAPY
jgi:hypothetical protein